jgi:hypothetical protein
MKIENLINYILSKTGRKLLTLDWKVSVICAVWSECDADEHRVLKNREE